MVTKSVNAEINPQFLFDTYQDSKVFGFNLKRNFYIT